MFKIFILTAIFFSSLFSKSFTVASYNVENLFDLNYSHTEYKEYIPNKSSKWNQKSYKQKLSNISKVLRELNADIVALQEIESQKALDDLLKKLPKYRYSFFYKNKKSPIGLAIISKYKIEKNSIIKVSSKINRPIIKSRFKIDNKTFYIFNNHWPSKRNSESFRVQYALALYNELKKSSKSIDYIITGDLNSNYNEYETFAFNKKLNDTSNLTAINHLLNTTINNNYILKNSKNKKIVHYNLWLELAYQNRLSSIYKGENTTPDNILLPLSLFDNKNISFVNNSFKVFKASYLIKNRKINRWQMNKRIHKAKGYSDHLPIIATFNTKAYVKEKIKIASNIKELYTKHRKESVLKDSIVLYKTENKAIIKRHNDRAILLYKDINRLKEGYSYDLKVLEVSTYLGLKEITKFRLLREKKHNKDYEKLFLDASKIDIFNLKYQNEVIKNLEGLYKNGYLYFKDKKIKLYAKEKTLLPKNGENITIIKAHLGYFKNKVQINIYKKSDIKVNP